MSITLPRTSQQRSLSNPVCFSPPLTGAIPESIREQASCQPASLVGPWCSTQTMSLAAISDEFGRDRLVDDVCIAFDKTSRRSIRPTKQGPGQSRRVRQNYFLLPGTSRVLKEMLMHLIRSRHSSKALSRRRHRQVGSLRSRSTLPRSNQRRTRGRSFLDGTGAQLQVLRCWRRPMHPNNPERRSR